MCKVTLQSWVSGSTRSFSLFILPNPAEYYQANFDKSALVPILVGMDFLGPEGNGMLIDFTTGLAMMTKETNPEIFQLNINHKGHLTLDIVQYLTKGHRCLEGNAHVVVREACSNSGTSLSQQMLELWTVWIDLSVCDRQLQARDLEQSRGRIWSMYHHAQRLRCSNNLSAQMTCATGAQQPSTTSPSSSSLCDGSLQECSPGDRPRDRADTDRRGEGQERNQEEGEIARSITADESRSEGPSLRSPTVAMLREASAGSAPIQPSRRVDSLRSLQPQAPLHATEGFTGEQHGDQQWPDGQVDASRTPASPGHNSSHGQGVSPHDEQDHGGSRSGQVHPRPEEQRDHRRVLFADEYHMGLGGQRDQPRRGADCGARGGARPNHVRYQPKVYGAPVFIGKRIMTLAATMASSLASMLVDLHLTGREGLWEISCAPHSRLSETAKENGLQPRAINLHNGYDLYQKETWQRLRQLHQQHLPQRLWFSLPSSKWCSWTTMQYTTEDQKEKLSTMRRKERRLLWEVNAFIKDCLAKDPYIQIYFEWPHPCFGWKQHPMEDLSAYMENHGIPWLPCRVDGCNYGLRDEETGQFVKKQWLIKTTDELFHRQFRSKVCARNHGVHCTTEGKDLHVDYYYPRRFVQGVVLHWRDQMAPSRHRHLLQLRADLPSLEDFSPVSEDAEDFMIVDEAVSDDEETLPVDMEVMFNASERIVVEHMAREIRLQKQYSFLHIQDVLLRFAEQLASTTSSTRPHARGTRPGHNSITLGAYSHGAFHGITLVTQRFGELVRMLNGFLRSQLPQERWSTLMISYNVKTLPHRDVHNHQCSRNIVAGFGNFENGGLWIHGEPPDGTPLVRRQLSDGSVQRGYVRDVRHQLVTFDPKTLHATQGWKGTRLVVSAYTTRLVEALSKEDRRKLYQLEFPLPRHQELQASKTQELSKIPSSSQHQEPQASETQDSRIPSSSHGPFFMSSSTRSQGCTGHDRYALASEEVPAVPQAEIDAWKAKISKIHRAAGHPTNRNLAKIIKDGGHAEWKIKTALEHYCPACASLRPGGTSSGQVPPAATTPMWKAWQAVTVDVGEWNIPGTKQKAKFALFMDMATKLRVVQPLLIYEVLAMQAESTDEVIQSFAERWLGAYPKPEVVILDAAYSFASEKMHDFLASVNIQPHFVADKEKWAHGVAEAGIQDVKQTATAIHMDCLDQHPFVTLQLTVASLNSTEYTAGYSAFQWAFGQNYTISDEDVRTYASLPEDQQGDFAQLVVRRQKAEEIARKTRSQRVLSKLTNTTVRQPLRQFKEMDLVKIWRKLWPREIHKGPRGGFKMSGRPHWIGPGRVVFHEILPRQEADDQRRHIVWVLIGSRLYRMLCSLSSTSD